MRTFSHWMQALVARRNLWLAVAGLWLFSAFSVWLRGLPYGSEPLMYGYLETVCSVLAITIAANAVLRFRGASDRVALMMAFGFALFGGLETLSVFAFHRGHFAVFGPLTPDSVEWMTGRTFLASLLLLALFVEHRLPRARHPGREVASALTLAVAVAYLTVIFFGVSAWLGAPLDATHWPGAWAPRPGHLLPAAVFLLSAVWCWRRLPEANSPFDRALFLFAAMSAASHLLAAHAGHVLDLAFASAMILKVLSYVVLLGGGLLDNVRLFERVRQLASSDPLTGLANYRRFLDVLNAEFQRSQRTGRSFAILLLDLDGLKRINDRLGHEAGSRAICRLAEVLQSHCRAVDTAARFGGDEFALILPETDVAAATRVAQRIRERMAADEEKPPISASIGVAVFPRHARSLEELQRVADQELYAMKRSLRRKRKAAKADAA